MFGKSQKYIGQLQHGLFIQVAGDAEIHQADTTVEHDDRIARVRVGVEQTEFHQLARE